MQLVGFVFIIVSLWLAYCGLNSFIPQTLASAILADPKNATPLIEEARKEVAATKGTFGSGGGTGGNASTEIKQFSGAYGPFSPFKISDSYAAHVARGSTSPGIDFVMPSGTNLYTPFSGTLHNEPNANPAAGNEVWVTLADGYQFVIMHVSKLFDNLEGQHVSAGQLIALSGGDPGTPGSGDSTGAHAHVGLLTPSGGTVPFTNHAFG